MIGDVWCGRSGVHRSPQMSQGFIWVGVLTPTTQVVTAAEKKLKDFLGTGEGKIND